MPDARSSWIVPENADEYSKFQSLGDIFSLYTPGVKTNRDEVVYDWHREKLAKRVESFIGAYNAEAYRHKADPDADWPDRIKWSETLKRAALGGSSIVFGKTRTVPSLYRPFSKKFLYFDRLINERVYQWASISEHFRASDVGKSWVCLAFLCSDIRSSLRPTTPRRLPVLSPISRQRPWAE
jgi:predicted helicase